MGRAGAYGIACGMLVGNLVIQGLFFNWTRGLVVGISTATVFVLAYELMRLMRK